MARPDPLADAEQAARAKLTKGKRAAQAYRPSALYDNPTLISERWSCAVARFLRIFQGIAKSSDVIKAVAGAEYPALTREAVELWFYYFTDRFRPAPLVGVDRNPFRGLSDKDATRKFMRMVEDVCDRSTGKLGSWYAGISVTGAARNR